jgi:hypothetical protein
LIRDPVDTPPLLFKLQSVKMPSWNAPRAKVQLKLAIQRTKMLQEKMEAMQKAARKDISALVEKGKLETARVKTEGLINTDVRISMTCVGLCLTILLFLP